MRASAVLAALLLCGCGATTQYLLALPPAELLQDCPIPMDPIPTNADLARRDAARKAALVSCNDDKAALREWARSKGTP